MSASCPCSHPWTLATNSLSLQILFTLCIDYAVWLEPRRWCDPSLLCNPSLFSPIHQATFTDSCVCGPQTRGAHGSRSTVPDHFCQRHERGNTWALAAEPATWRREPPAIYSAGGLDDPAPAALVGFLPGGKTVRSTEIRFLYVARNRGTSRVLIQHFALAKLMQKCKRFHATPVWIGKR